MAIGAFDAQTSRFLNDIGRIAQRLEKAQLQITSGRKINVVSDSPDQISHLLATRSQLSATQQIHSNLDRVKGEVDAAEGALSQAVSIVDRISTLGTQGATDTISADGRASLADEIGSLLEQLVNIAATKVDGRYVFSGDTDTTAPYTSDLGTDPPYSVYQGAASSRKIEHPSGARIQVSLTADEIFDDPDQNKSVFASVNDLRKALLSNDTQQVKDALGRVLYSNTHLNNKLAFYGSAQNQVAEGQNVAFKQELRLKNEISSIEDADLTEAILELNQAQLQQSAALGAQAQIRNKRTLLDYLG
ncbi:MAG: flagellin [Acidobacteriota bacterium]